MLRHPQRINENDIECFLFPQLKEESKIFSNFQDIVAKVKHDGHLKPIYSTLNAILESEKEFAFNRSLKRNSNIEARRLEWLFKDTSRDQHIHL
jgi:hypothetical protein